MRERSKSESYSVPDYESSECIIPPPSLFPPSPLSHYIPLPSFPPPPPISLYPLFISCFSSILLSPFPLLPPPHSSSSLPSLSPHPLTPPPPLSLPFPPTPSLLTQTTAGASGCYQEAADTEGGRPSVTQREKTGTPLVRRRRREGL